MTETSIPLKRPLSPMTSDISYARSGRAAPQPPRLPTPPTSSPPQEPAGDEPDITNLAREIYLDFMREEHPEMTPENDFELLMLGSHRLPGAQTVAEKRLWLHDQWEKHVQTFGTAEAVMQNVRVLLESVVDSLTGLKPRPGDPNVAIMALPDSAHSVRLWPGSLASAEYCLDFVETQTGKPINVPDDYTLWFVPPPNSPWLQGVGPVQLISLERSWGVPPTEILEGEEKFVLRDGMTCVVRRPGKRDALFTVPLRQQSQTPYDTMDVLTLPQ